MASKKNTEKQTGIDSEKKDEFEDEDNSSEIDIITDDESDDDESEEENESNDESGEGHETNSDEKEEIDDDSSGDLFWDKAVHSVYENQKDDFQKNVAQMGKKNPNTPYEDIEKDDYEKMRPQYDKDLRKYYLQFLQEMHSLKQSRVHKDVIETAKRLRDMEDYDYDEALQYAVKKRKFLISKKLDEYQHPQLESVDEQ